MTRVTCRLAFALSGLLMCACAPSTPPATRDLVFLTRGECVNTPTLAFNLEAALGALGLPSDYQVVDLDTLPKTDARIGYPTPTLLYRDRDVFGLPAPVPPYPEPT